MENPRDKHFSDRIKSSVGLPKENYIIPKNKWNLKFFNCNNNFLNKNVRLEWVFNRRKRVYFMVRNYQAMTVHNRVSVIIIMNLRNMLMQIESWLTTSRPHHLELQFTILFCKPKQNRKKNWHRSRKKDANLAVKNNWPGTYLVTSCSWRSLASRYFKYAFAYLLDLTYIYNTLPSILSMQLYGYYA